MAGRRGADPEEERANAGRPLRIAYVAGPGDLIGTYRHWRAGHADPRVTSHTFSGQFYDVCTAFGAQALVIAPSGLEVPTETELDDGPFRIVRRRHRFAGVRGLRYHYLTLKYELWLIASILRFRPDVLVIADGIYWPLIEPLAWLGIKVIPTLHCVLWRQNRPISRATRWLNRMSAPLFRRRCFAILSASHDISEQVHRVAGGPSRPILEFLSTYPQDFLGPCDPPEEGPFRVLFVGRIERVKGVFDVLAIARRFLEAGRTDITFELCGKGTALEELKAAATAAGLPPGRFLCRGHCNHSEMLDAYARCHAVIVPTTSDFVEGFNAVVAEAILAGRPVVTSSICPAIQYVRHATAEVPPDDVRAYGDALLRLADDREYYEGLRRNCLAPRQQFCDPENTWGSALREVLAALREGREPVGRTVPIPDASRQRIGCIP
jgi:glycosyltransferase involved in cell wall biosynthesis